jgi:hypothetical protein
MVYSQEVQGCRAKSNTIKLLKALARRQQVAMNPNVPCKCTFSVPKKSITNKENIQYVVTNTHKTTRVNRVLVKVVRGKWTY